MVLACLKKIFLLFLVLGVKQCLCQCTAGTFMLQSVCVECPTGMMSLTGATECTIPYTAGFQRLLTSLSVYTIPTGVNQIRVDAFGAMAPAPLIHSVASSAAARGGYVSALVSVTGGVSIAVVLGSSADIRTVYADIASTASLTSRIIVAGGGGRGFNNMFGQFKGGDGGGLTGGSGITYVDTNHSDGSALGGTGGSQTAGGAAGTIYSVTGWSWGGTSGVFGYGGTNMESIRGGDGWYGGGGGGFASGAGGGSSYISSSAAGITNAQGYYASETSRVYITVTGCASGYVLNGVACVLNCAVGYYKTTNNGVESCTACPNGFATASAGAISMTSCLTNLCAPGYGGDGVTCTSCTIGSYKTSAGNAACIMCDTGVTTSATGSTSASSCSQCAPGYSGTGSTCTICAAGTTSVVAGATSCVTAVQCTAGMYALLNVCTECPAGMMSLAGATECIIPYTAGFKRFSITSMSDTSMYTIPIWLLLEWYT